jgi:hypothetical protein
MEILMNAMSTELGGHPSGGAGNQEDKHLVTISVDGVERQIARGKYGVSELKAAVNVPATYELDQVVDGEFKALADDGTVHVKGGEAFVSHVRRGGSS